MLYESVVILSGQITPKSAETKLEKLIEKINASGGKVLKKESWGLRSLSYKIKKNSKGYYYLLNSECQSNVLNDFSKLIKQDDEFLRILNLRIKAVEKEPSPLEENNNKEKQYEK